MYKIINYFYDALFFVTRTKNHAKVNDFQIMWYFVISKNKDKDHYWFAAIHRWWFSRTDRTNCPTSFNNMWDMSQIILQLIKWMGSLSAWKEFFQCGQKACLEACRIATFVTKFSFNFDWNFLNWHNDAYMNLWPSCYFCDFFKWDYTIVKCFTIIMYPCS